jgi:hypothetical protein
MEATGETLMGHVQFLNQDNEWESFPSEEEEANLRANAEALELLGYMLICQMCNSVPTWNQIRHRWINKEWTCNTCHTINSAGKA